MEKSQRTNCQKYAPYIVVTVLQIVIIILFGLFFDIDDLLSPKVYTEKSNEEINKLYQFLIDTNVMIFVGFGLINGFLRKNSWTGSAMTFFIGALGVQLSMLTIGFWRCVFTNEWKTIKLNINWILDSDFAAVTTIISYCGVLGKFSVVQYVIMGIIEAIFYGLNIVLFDKKLHAVDVGGSTTVHVFSTFFGLALSWFAFYGDKKSKNNPNQKTSYYTNVFNFLGTLVFWVYWPSINTAIVQGSSRYRGILNTYLSLVSSCIGAYVTSGFVHEGKFGMADIVNATIAGGVIIGGCCNILLYPFGALIIGFCGGAVTTIGYSILSKIFQEKLNLYDVCGILNLHGIPGFLGGIIEAIVISTMSSDKWGEGYLDDLTELETRSPSKQAWFQIAAIFMTIGISSVGGLLTGIILKFGNKCLCQPEEYFDDTYFWSEEEAPMQKQKDRHIQIESEMQHIAKTKETDP